MRLLAPAHWAFGSCVMGYLSIPSCIRESSLTSKSLTIAHLNTKIFFMSCFNKVTNGNIIVGSGFVKKK